jgi:hypothetical protein
MRISVPSATGVGLSVIGSALMTLYPRAIAWFVFAVGVLIIIFNIRIINGHVEASAPRVALAQLKKMGVWRAGALAVVFLAALAVAAYAWVEGRNYKIDFWEPQIELMPYDLERSAVQGAVVSLAFDNPNNFPIWVQARRRSASVNQMTGKTAEPSPPWEAPRNSGFRVSGAPIPFTSLLHPNQVAEGTADFQICYGRWKDQMDKGYAISGDLKTRFDTSGQIEASFSNPVITEGTCDSGQRKSY